MDDEAVTLPEADGRRCMARTHAGASCRAPPLTDSRFCTFHDQRPEIVALMAKARGTGLQRERVLAHAGEPLPVDLEDANQLRAFERGVLKRLLVGAIAPAAASAAVDLARSIVREEQRASPGEESTVDRLVARIMATPPSPIDADDSEESDLPPALDAAVRAS